MNSFETLILPEEFYINLIHTSLNLILVSVIIMIVFNGILVGCHSKFRVKVLWFGHIPKIIVSVIAIVYIFFYDYGKMAFTGFHVDNLLFTTFLVGILAIIEALNSFIAIAAEIMSMIKQ